MVRAKGFSRESSRSQAATYQELRRNTVNEPWCRSTNYLQAQLPPQQLCMLLPVLAALGLLNMPCNAGTVKVTRGDAVAHFGQGCGSRNSSIGRIAVNPPQLVHSYS